MPMIWPMLVARADPRLSDSGWVRSVLDQVAAATRRMHAEGFVHNDLKWRNLLVTRGDVPHVHFIDCPNGGFWWGPFLRYRIVKDLACLDKGGQVCAEADAALRFFLSYLGSRVCRLMRKTLAAHRTGDGNGLGFDIDLA